jgi:multicomponent Na+:H+ antiporter subunit G
MEDPAAILGEVVVSALLLGGSFFMLVTVIGLIRFPDVYCRMHAAGKAGPIGVALFILAPVVYFATSEPWVSARGILAIIFQALTTPAATYLLAHACYATRHPRHGRTGLDELAPLLPAYPEEEFGPE